MKVYSHKDENVLLGRTYPFHCALGVANFRDFKKQATQQLQQRV